MLSYKCVSQAANAAFPGLFFIPVAAAARFAGFSPKTAYNLGADWPIPTIKQGKLRLVPLPALVNYVSSQLAAAGVPDTPALPSASSVPTGTLEAEGSASPAVTPKRGPGRPRKLAAGGAA